MSLSVELRDRDLAESWLSAALCLMRMAQPSATTYLRIAPWLTHSLSNTGWLPPAGVLADIGHLLTGRAMRELAPLPPLSPELTHAVHAYEDHLLGRLDADPRLDAVSDALARLAEDKRDRGVALFIGHLCRRLGFTATVAISPGVIRGVIGRPADELISVGYAALAADGEVERALVAGYRDLVTSARRMGMLISESEVFLMENLDALGDLTQRIAIEQIIEATDALTAAMPRRLKPNAKAEVARIPTELTAVDNYPTGGFSSLATSGTIENLVSSELIYMEDDEPPSIDLFDIRYAEGELLYYTRDDSVFVRGRRVVTFVLMPDLVNARFKDPELSWQRLVLVLGVITCSVRRLVEWLAREGLSFHVLFVRDPRAQEEHPLATERSLCELSLREFIDKDLVHVSECAGLEVALTLAGEWAKSARSDVLVISTSSANTAAGRASPDIRPSAPPGVLLGSLCLSEPEPRLVWGLDAKRARPHAVLHGSKDSYAPNIWLSWVQCTLEILQTLL